MLKKLFPLLLLLGFAGSARAQTPNSWTYVQDSNILFCSQAGSAASCSIGSAQITPTLAGSVWILQVKTVNNVTIQNITGGGGTWIKCQNCHVTNPVNGGNIDAWYNLTGNAGTTQNITVTLSAASGGNGMGINFEEFLPPAGTTASFDVSGTVTPAACTTCTGVGLNITGTDFIWMSPGNGTQLDWKSVSAPWIIAGNGSMLNINATSGTAPTINYDLFNGNPISPTLMAIAFKSSAGVFTPPSYLSQNSIVQFTSPPTNPANLTPFCNPTCTLTLPQATQAGHLLFVMATNLSNSRIVSATGGGTWLVPSGANTCQAHWSLVQASGAIISCAYVLSSTAGATSVSVTLSGNASSGLAVWEVASNTGLPWTLDTQGSRQNGTNNFSPPGVSLAISGKNDVIFQGGFVPGGSSDASFYPHTYIAHQGVGYILFNETAEQVLLNSGPTAPTSLWINPQGALQDTGMTAIAFTASGRNLNAADCSFATVSALNAVAADGDTINLPACAQTNWGNNSTTGNGNLSVNKCVTISGAGQGSTIIGDNVLKDGQFNSMPFLFSASCGAIPRGLGNLTIVGVAPDASVFAKGYISLGGSGSAFRVHHVTLTTPRTEFAVADYVGHALFDHNSITGCSQGVGGIDMRSSAWNGGQFGDGSWADSTPLPGSSNAYYVEDNTWNCGTQAQSAQTIDGHLGARWVVRFNTITSGAFTSHGTDQDRRRSMRWVEYYDNRMDFNSVTGGPSYFNWMRGGTGVVFDNTWSGQNPGSGTRTFYCRIASIPCGPISVWGACDGTGAYDGNQPSQNGHICVDQQGAGTSNLISGATPTPVAPVNNILQPIYSFHNTLDGGQTGSPVQVNRDIYLQDLTNCTSSGCTAGIGRGPGASKPATCTLNTGWWAIDEGFWNTKTPGVPAGQLYRCGASNNWVLYATPYTYPDPLQGTSAPITGPAANLYLAQTAIGSADGSSCANALAASYFNSSANWGTGLTQIGSGTTVHLCGGTPIGISLTAPTSQGTGLITILFEPGAMMQQAAATNFITIANKTNSYLITGQTPCGWINHVVVPCPEKIQNTANGSPGAFANTVVQVVGINPSGTTGSVTVRWLELSNLYQHTDPNDSAYTNGADLARGIADDVMMGSLTMKEMIIHDTSWAIPPNPRQASATAPNGPPVLTIANVEFFNNDHDIALGSSCNPSCYSVVIHDIHSHDHSNWNTGANAYHHDGIHIFNSPLQVSSALLYNSLFDGPWNGNTTGPLFNQVAIQNLTAFNNVFICLPGNCPNDPIALWQYGGGPNQFLANNTFIQTGLPPVAGGTSPNNAGVLMTNPNTVTTGGVSTNVSFLNNIVDSAANEVTFNAQVMAPNTSTSGLDFNLYSNPITNGSKNFNCNGVHSDLLSGWQNSCGEGVHSQLIGNGLLAVDGTPQTGSLAIGGGTNLTPLCIGALIPLCSDYNGFARPALGAWNIGAIGNPNGGCGNSLLYDETDCGASAATPYTAIDPAITVANGTQISNCGFTFASGTNYLLAANIGSSATANCLTFTGLSNVNVDLGGFTVTGAVSLTTASGANQKVHLYHGGITCSLSGGTTNPCLGINNNQTTAVSGAFKFHHLTIQNTFDSGTNNVTSTGTPFAVGGDLGHNTLTGDTFAFYFQYNTVLLTNNNYASGRTGAVQIVGGLAPLKFTNNSITIGGGEAASQGIVCYGCVSGSQIDNNMASLSLSLYGSPNVSSRAFMFDASQGTSVNPLEIAFNDVITNDHRCVRVRDSDFPYVHDNYCRGVRFGGASGSNNGTLGAFHMGDPNSFPSTAITNIACSASATAVDGCTITLSGTQNWVGHEGDVITISAVTPVSLQETVTVTTGNPSTPNTVKYASNNAANNNVASSGAIAFVYSNAMNGLVLNNNVQVDCTVNKGAIIFADRASTGNVFNLSTITTNGDCSTGFTGALYKRYLNAAKDNFTIKNTTLTNPLGGASYPLLATSGGPSGALQQFGFFCSTLGVNGTTDGDLGWSIAASCPGAALATLSQTVAAFFNQMAGTTTSLPTLVTLTNNGGAPLTISGLAMNGTNPTEFNQTNNCGTGLAAGASCTISITFSPSALGPRSATLNINDNAAGSPQTVALSGNGMKSVAGTGIITGTGSWHN